jgi:hypothetical protein
VKALLTGSKTCTPVRSPCKSRWNAVETPNFSENQKLPSMFVCCKPSGICILGCGRSHAHKISCLGARCYDCLTLFTGTELDVCREAWCFIVTSQCHMAHIKRFIVFISVGSSGTSTLLSWAFPARLSLVLATEETFWRSLIPQYCGSGCLWMKEPHFCHNGNFELVWRDYRCINVLGNYLEK